MDVRYGAVAALLLVPCSAYPSGHNFDMMASGSIVKFNDKPKKAGISGTKSISRASDDEDPKITGLYFVIARTSHAHPKLAYMADASWNFNEQGDQGRKELTQVSLIVGPRVELLRRRLSPIVQVLPLGVRFGSKDIISTSGLSSVGAALECKFGKYGKSGQTGTEWKDGTWAARAGYDRLILWGKKPQDRFFLGIVFRYSDH